ncbi:nicotinamide riboside transporter PnuC [Liquorilactobacillus hordei]|uniref:Nicotinamide mononucleotide transporter n=1 Tax=Liquorilactobacillus hordei DSM 19519 TaxID=1423759 RepID=A0A0R1MJ65_9LACO|nr:nicotinamide riboside transporter PnuC [Liquorilactobacillus hordei]KRL07999.1 Nicotinamide mononucleotide transporter [Liquorilactobacillus hordei DSM 19519]QYH51057.1 nicotinamide mononucleotide transporter [Liquorilactobacillus hordei DSM 19519]
MFSRYADVLSNLSVYSKNVFRKGYFSWLINQCKGWGKFSYGLILFNFVLQVISLLQSFSGSPLLSVLSFIGGNLSVACVVGISNKSGIQGWLGATSAICIASVGFMAGNFATAWEQIGYLIFLDLFCILDPKWNDNIQAEKFKNAFEWVKYIVFFVVAWGVIYYLFSLTSDPRVFLDSMNLAMAITGSLLELNRKREQYFVWTISSVFTIALWTQTMLQGDGNFALIFSYSVFFLNDMYAFFSKKGWFRKQDEVATESK